MIDALFTATSATCVTGLNVVDTGTYWTTFGQYVILGLIQLGGLGIMTLSSFFAFVVVRKLGMRGRDLIEQSYGGGIRHVGHLLVSIILVTLLTETMGAAILTLRFAQDFPLSRALYLGVFHSISAFCNAGFSPFTDGLIRYQSDWIVNLTIMTLIIVGGLGFWVIFDFRNLILQRRHLRHLNFHSKLVLTTTGYLILIGTVLFLLLEWNHMLKALAWDSKFLISFFQAITPRTAGFNTVDIGHLSPETLLLLMILMFIGASPGSTGGGIKTTTFVVILSLFAARFREERQVQFFKRGIPERIISKSISILFFMSVTVCIALMALLVSESHGLLNSHGQNLFLEGSFEILSAIGTVGLSMGITPLLSATGKMLIILLMFVGRIGPITVAIIIAGKQPAQIRLAEEEFWVG